MSLADDLGALLDAAPDLIAAPQLVSPILQQGGDINGNGQVAARAGIGMGVDQSVKDLAPKVGGVQTLQKAVAQHHSGLFGSIGHFFTSAAQGAQQFGQSALDFAEHPIASIEGVPSEAMNIGQQTLATAGKPLADVQHEYRYLHDVAQRHGMADALLEAFAMTAGAAVGGTAGFFTAGPAGAMAGATAGAEATGHLTGLIHQDSWDRTKDGNVYRDPDTGQPVSIGRDIAGALGLKPHSSSYNIISGVSDGISDLALDPTSYLAGVGSAARGAEGLGGLAAARFGGTAPKTVEDVDRIYRQYGSFRNAVNDIADQTPGEIAANYPRLRNLAAPLGNATTPDKVLQVFRNAVRARELTMTDRLPTLTLTRMPFTMTGRALLNYQGPGSLAIRRVATRLPDAFDPELNKISNDHFNLGDDYASTGIYRTAMMGGETRQTALALTDQYLRTTDPGERLRIYRNVLKTALISRGSGLARSLGHSVDPTVFDDPEVLKRVSNVVDDLTGGSQPWHNGIYAADGERNISRITGPSDTTLSAAVTDNQIGKIAFPDYVAVKRVAAEIAGGQQLTGNVDDFLYQHVTQNFFKRWVLMTPSFALHVGIGEALLNSARLGFKNYLQGAIVNNSVALGIKGEQDGLLPLMAKHVSDVLQLPAKIPVLGRGLKQDIDLATKNALWHDSHVTPTSASAGAHVAAEADLPVEAAGRNLRHWIVNQPRQQVGTKDFAMFGPGSHDYARGWSEWGHEITSDTKHQVGARAYLDAYDRAGLPIKAEEPANALAAVPGTDLAPKAPELLGPADEQARHATAAAASTAAVKTWLDQQPNAYLKQFARHYHPGIGHEELDPHESWGRVVTANMLGVTTSQTGKLNRDLLQAVADGDTSLFHRANLEQRLDQGPALVKGREYMSEPASGLQRVANLGFRTVLNPIINYISRQPVYFAEFKRQYLPLQKSVEAGLMTDDEAMHLANTRAMNEMIRFVHNIDERSQFAQTVRNFVPFYFAQEQAYKRVGRLLATNPMGFRRYQLMLQGLHDVGAENTDANGNSYLAYPGSGLLGQAVPGMLHKLGIPVIGSVPVGFLGSLTSANVILPFGEGAAGLRPGVGPVVSIPVKSLNSLFHGAFTPQAHALLGDISFNQPLWKQFIPNVALQRAIETGGGAMGLYSPGFKSAILQTMQLLDYQQSKAMDAWVKAGHSPNDPGAPRIVPPADAGPMEQQQFVDRVRNQTVILYGMKTLLGLVTPLSPQIKVEDYGFPQELQKEVKAAGSVNQGIVNFIQKNPDATPWTVFQSHSQGSVPPTQAAEDWVNSHGDLIQKYPYAAFYLMPQKASTGSFSQAVYNEQVAQGLRSRDTPDQFLQDLYIASGNHQYFDVDKPKYEQLLKDNANDPTALSNIHSEWSAYQNQMKLQNPVWATHMTSGVRQREAQLGIQQLQELDQNGVLQSGGAQGELLHGLLADYAQYQAMHQAGVQNGWAQYSNTQLSDGWDTYLQQMAAQLPIIAPAINKLFRSA